MDMLTGMLMRQLRERHLWIHHSRFIGSPGRYVKTKFRMPKGNSLARLPRSRQRSDGEVSYMLVDLLVLSGNHQGLLHYPNRVQSRERRGCPSLEQMSVHQ